MARKTTNDSTAKARKKRAALAGAGTTRVYTLEAFLIGGPVTRKFAKKNRVVSRAIAMRGDQTLQDLHDALFDAFGREEEHMYEVQFGGKGPMDPQAACYVLPSAFNLSHEEGRPAAGRVDQTTLNSLGLKEGDRFGYWFDFGDDWWHQINVEAIEDKLPRGKYPRVTKKVGKSPLQYADLDEEE
ncbi:MAG: hypothetical protein HYS12_28235 [Planctomycetes bacterium]|nr:hypothetical protein [Planctomycetota bacterium]